MEAKLAMFKFLFFNNLDSFSVFTPKRKYLLANLEDQGKT
jgi:hypothetical protein